MIYYDGCKGEYQMETKNVIANKTIYHSIFTVFFSVFVYVWEITIGQKTVIYMVLQVSLLKLLRSEEFSMMLCKNCRIENTCSASMKIKDTHSLPWISRSGNIINNLILLKLWALIICVKLNHNIFGIPPILSNIIRPVSTINVLHHIYT